MKDDLSQTQSNGLPHPFSNPCYNEFPYRSLKWVTSLMLKWIMFITNQVVKSGTSSFHSKESVAATHELQRKKETICTCIKDSQFKSAQ